MKIRTRLLLLLVALLVELGALVVLGIEALGVQVEGLRGRRAGEFAAVAEQTRRTVKFELDRFLDSEQQRPYTDYLPRYVPAAATAQQQVVVLPSPLADRFAHHLARGHFQIDSQGHLLTPYQPGPQDADEVSAYLDLLRRQLAPRLARGEGTALRADRAPSVPVARKGTPPNYPVDALQANRQGRVERQSRQSLTSNALVNQFPAGAQLETLDQPTAGIPGNLPSEAMPGMSVPDAAFARVPQQAATAADDELVEVHIDALVPWLIPAARHDAVFGHRVFLLRAVRYDGQSFWQGFELDQLALRGLVDQVAQRLVPESMTYRLNEADAAAAYVAVLDFGFGELPLVLAEADPGRIAATARRWRWRYFFTLAGHTLAVLTVLVGIGYTLRAQNALVAQKDDFIAAVSHELRTPLTSIRMYAEMLEKDWVADAAKRQAYYAHVRQESERLSRLIENVLDFSRIQRRKKQYHFVSGDLNAAVADAVAALQPQAQQIGFTLHLAAAPAPAVPFDRDAVMQMVVNLIDNALKYAADAPDRKIQLRTTYPHGQAVIEVEDHGPGVPREQREKIFASFYRAASETTRPVHGIGLGLALVQELAQAHRGRVELQSVRPHGACFRIILPRPG